MKSKYLRVLCSLCAAVLMIAALSVGALAGKSIEEQMAANSAAWIIAHNAGDQATCDALHAANVALAAQAAGESGSASYNSEKGTWDITTDNGSTIRSGETTKNGKTETISYSTTTASGSVSTVSDRSYTDSSIASYKHNGGTNSGLVTSYNNAADYVSENMDYGVDKEKTTASSEVAVAKAVLGLTDQQAAALEADLLASKQAYASAYADYTAAINSGNTAAAEAAKGRMDAAHAAAQATRSAYNYSGDSNGYSDGGYFKAGGYPAPDDDDFFTTSITPSYTITASATEGGTISPSGDIKVNKGESKTFTLTANTGYFLQDVIVDGVSVGAKTSYTFSNVQGPHTISAKYIKRQYTISASAGTGGSISPSGNRTVNYNSNATFYITPNVHNEVASVIVDGVDVGAVRRYTFSNVTAEHTISATFEKTAFEVTASCGQGGRISPSGTLMINKGRSMTYWFTPNIGYRISDVLVDNVSVGTPSSYTLQNVAAEHTVYVSFERITCTISAAAGQGGSISPSGSSIVYYGESMTYHITPAAGFEIENVVVDGQSMGPITSYTFQNVTSAHSISATFQPAGRVKLGTPVLSGTANGGTIRSGYGFGLCVPVTTQNVSDVQVTLTYDFGSGSETVNLESSDGSYVLPVATASPTGARVVYIPVGTQDGSYTLTVTVTAKKLSGAVVSDSTEATIRVLGSMYEDDFTGDS